MDEVLMALYTDSDCTYSTLDVGVANRHPGLSLFEQITVLAGRCRVRDTSQELVAEMRLIARLGLFGR